MANKRTIILKGTPIINEEGVASEAINPGYLVKGVSTIAKQTGSTTAVLPVAVALERDEFGAGIDDTYRGAGTIAAAYASGDVVKVAALYPGCEFVGYIPSGQNIVEDDKLQSAGTGLFIEGTDAPIVRAMETVGAVTVETAVRLQVIR
jgi:hypothetical protein